MRVGKVLVIGAGEAGKSTLIQALSDDAMNLEVGGRTVAMDHATLVDGDRRLSLVGVPGQKRFDVVRSVLAEGARGAVWVHRAGDPIDPQTTDLVLQLGGKTVPYIVYVNHSDGAEPNGSWNCPEGCGQPRTIIEGNLLHPGASLFVLWKEIWKLAATPANGHEKGA